MPHPQPDEQRRFAVDIVRRLRAAGYEAYWAGGCVRDQLLGRLPKDYDVATSARPTQIRDLFGHRQTLAIGAAFGVITVIGTRTTGNIEVATFRVDATYSDGRHPDRVSFTSAAEDARRRDFTINGLFYDPIDNSVIDFVGGQEDLGRRLIRAIGDADERFNEDKLRMLRAVRFAAAFGFELDAATHAAIVRRAGEIDIVSPERIAAEMRRLLTESGRARGMRLLLDTRLAAIVLPELTGADGESIQRALRVIERLEEPSLSLALAGLLFETITADAMKQLGYRWRLSNKEVERAAWLTAQATALADARRQPWSRLQPVLIEEGIDDLLRLTEAAWPDRIAEVEFCRARLAMPRESLDPPPLLTGDDLVAGGHRPGPRFARILRRLREAQLDGEITTRGDAMAMLDRLARGR